MSVLSYLNDVSSSLVLSSAETLGVAVSVQTIKNRITSYFGSEIIEQFKFGSYDRGTMLPRKYDDKSDVDYMVVFKNPNDYKPQTLLDRLRTFTEHSYPTSEIHQSRPTIVLELQHIMFELVPAQKDYSGALYIPSNASSNSDWMWTDPNGFGRKMEIKNMLNSNNIKHLVRLMKYWNVRKLNHGFSSFSLEQFTIDATYSPYNTLEDLFYHCINTISCGASSSQSLKDGIARAKTSVKNILNYKLLGMTDLAESEIKNLVPLL